MFKMKMRRGNIYYVGLITLLGTSFSMADQPEDPPVREIVNRAVERSESQLAANVDVGFEALVRFEVDSVDARGTVTDTKTSLFSRYPLYGAVHEELIEKEGRPLTEKEARKERKRRDEFIKEVKERTAQGKPPQPEDERQVRFDRDFMSRYKTKLIGEENIRGYSCWVIHFEPREGELPVHRRLDEALNKSTGKIWISQDDFGLARAQFEMREPIRYLAGLLATVRNTVGRLEFDRFEHDLWFPIDFELKLDMRVLFKNIRRNMTMNWSEYRRTDTGNIPLLLSRGTATR